MAARVEAARRAAAHPRILVSGYEQTLGSPFTCDTVAVLSRRHPDVRFVLLMGADSFADLHLWKSWRLIVETMPIGVIDRPGSTLRAAQSRVAAALIGRRLDERDAGRLAISPPPAYVILHDKRSPLSSTSLREGSGASDDLRARRDLATSWPGPARS